ncbi:MAG: 4Fe-4S dicluster domain-containing protein [Candidatus Geothermarchaeales archaeon]
MSQKAVDVYPDRCSGCRICELICSFHHEREFNITYSRIRILKNDRMGIDFPILCFQCEKAPCIDVCPVGAISSDRETGAISIDEDRCIVCRGCLIVCPYGALSLHTKRRTMIACDLCGGEPLCVEWCPNDALKFVSKGKIDMLRRRMAMEGMEKLRERV